jgi:hypothetical protein
MIFIVQYVIKKYNNLMKLLNIPIVVHMINMYAKYVIMNLI